MVESPRGRLTMKVLVLGPESKVTFLVVTIVNGDLTVLT
jgi:hypothetical protein